MSLAVPTIFITLIYFMAHLRYTAAAFFSNFFTVIVLGLVSRLPVQSAVFIWLLSNQMLEGNISRLPNRISKGIIAQYLRCP